MWYWYKARYKTEFRVQEQTRVFMDKCFSAKVARKFDEESLFPQMILRQLDIHMQKNKIGPLLHTHIKINLRLIKDLNIRAKTIKLLEEKNSHKSL